MLKCRRWGLWHRVHQALPFCGSMTGVCTGMCLAGCLEVPSAEREPAWPGCLLSRFPAFCRWERAGPALGTALLFWWQDSWAKAFGTITQNNCDLKWKDTGALGSIHIFHKGIRNSCFSRFLNSRKTWCFLFFFNFPLGTEIAGWESEAWTQRKHVSRSTETALAKVFIFFLSLLQKSAESKRGYRV